MPRTHRPINGGSAGEMQGTSFVNLAAHSYFTCVLNEQTIGLKEDFKCGIDIHFMLGALMPTCWAQTFKLIFPLADFFEFRTPWKLGETMASLWNTLRSEVMGTVDEFRQKGAIGALRDAALDTRDMATGAGSWLWGNVKSLGRGSMVRIPQCSFLMVSPARGATAPLQFSDGQVVEAMVMEVDGVSDPPRAQVKSCRH